MSIVAPAHSGNNSIEAIISVFTEHAALDEQIKIVLFHRILQKCPKLAKEILSNIEQDLKDSDLSDWQEQSFYMDGILAGLDLTGKGQNSGK